jgi:hypothetical protein
MKRVSKAFMSKDEDDSKSLRKTEVQHRLPAVAWGVLLAAPLLLWLLCILSGILLYASEPQGRVEHLMEDFDRFIFKRYGSILPFLPLLIRSMTTFHQSNHRSSLLKCLLVYSLISALRGGIYWLHLQYQGSEQRPLMSDHVLLASSVIALLHSEIIYSLDNLVEMEVQCTGLLRESFTALAFVLSISLFGLVSMNAHFTCRYFHHPVESFAAAGIGAIFFQAPVLHTVISKLRKTAR